MQSGKPVGVFRTTTDAPRVLIANANLVPHWATWEQFRELERAGLTMYGQMTAGSWIYIGTQGIMQGTYETFGEVARQHFGGSLRGTVMLTAGLGGMGGAQPLAVTMNEGACLVVEVDEARARRRLRRRLRRRADARPRRGGRAGRPMARRRRGALRGADRQRGRRRAGAGARGWRPDVVTDQTSAHDPLNGYVPDGMTLDEALALRATRPRRVRRAASTASMADHVRAMLEFQRAARSPSTTATTSARYAQDAGVEDAFDFPGFVPAFIRPLFCEGKGPFRWAALSGDPADIARTDDALARAVPRRRGPPALAAAGRARRSPFQGLPARICWLGYGERAQGRRALQRAGRVGRDQRADRHRPRPPRRRLGRRPVPRDRGDAGRLRRDRRLADPQRPGQHRRRRDLGQLPPRRRRRHRLLAARRAWSIVADGTPEAAARLERVLTTDPGMGVIRHADAGYERALEVAGERGVRIPMRRGLTDRWIGSRCSSSSSHVLLAFADGRRPAGPLDHASPAAAATDDVERSHLLAEAASPFERIVQMVSPLVGRRSGW